MNELDILIGRVARNAFVLGFVIGAAFVGIAVLVGMTV